MVVELNLPAVSEDEVTEARQILATVKDDAGGNFMKLVRAHRVRDTVARHGRPHRVEVQAIA